jgi:gluconolactonase
VTRVEATATELADVGFTEGPAVTGDGRLYVTSIQAGTVVEARDGAVIATHTIGGGPSGTAVAADGTVYVVQCSGLFGAPSDTPAGLYAIAQGDVTPVETRRLRAPNDICFGPDGSLYFTDPMADPTLNGPVEAPVYAYEPTSGKLRAVADGLLFPNGLAFEPDGESLLVAESCTGRVHRFPWSDGKLGPSIVVCEITDGPPDGIAVDTDGNIWVAVPDADAVEVFDARGTAVDRVECGAGSFPTNCCFGGPDARTLFITVAKAGAVLRLRPGARGLPLYG